MNLLFIDPKCPSPYDSEVLQSRGLGGTEATVVRIARALALGHDVRVVQHNRWQALQEGPRLRFLPPSSLDEAASEADHVVFVQKAQDISRIAARSKARLWLWLHNYLGDEVPFFWQDHLRHRLGIICVSRTHAEHTSRHLRRYPPFGLSARLLGRGGITYLHNPIDDRLAPRSGLTRDLDKMVFFSSPNKGIEQVIAAFRRVHARRPAFRLMVADPGYIRNFDLRVLDHPGITRIGSLPQHEVLRYVQESLCVFYPQHKRPETFGLVYAESNAMGVPVLAHDFGAAREVLADTNPPIDARDSEQVVATLLRWRRDGPPRVQADARFALTRIAAQWDEFLHGPEAFVRRRGLAPA